MLRFRSREFLYALRTRTTRLLLQRFLVVLPAVDFIMKNTKKTIVRVGQGYDLHRLEPGRGLILAGVTVPFEKGSVGHSDADVVFHAVIDALLGAAALGDIGEHFPDTDPDYKGIDSAVLLQLTLKKLRNAGFAPVNIDLTIVAEKPKLSDYKPAMRKSLSEQLDLDQAAVNIKAKTNEGLGPLGRGEAIACWAIASLAID
jgi:2-C-methyl-D-erythritol 2,4-cyclodiphosphate synthase